MTLEAVTNSLKHTFGFPSFRPMQEEIIQAVLDGKDSLVLMPTGGGKSLCYQLPATVTDGLTVVVSPLIALMKDQVEGLVENGIRAAFINSSQEFNEQDEIFRQVQNGEIDILYVSPEKLITPNFQYSLKKLNVRLFAIDEAHCISQWGHDFRPGYTQLRTLKQAFPDIPIIALTATADKTTRKDILAQLQLKDPNIFISSFDRPNLELNVLPARKRLDRIITFIKKRKNESGIIYCLSRKQTEKVATALQREGLKAMYYHAGMHSHERSQAQEDFIHGRTNIVVATIAFGMGIDKSNVRYVIHHNLPKNLEGYYQEIGRAGRDGLPSETLLFYSLADLVLLKKFATESGQPQLQLAKLERMQQFADALICRRRILLSYFGEEVTSDCKNCDVCDNPPELFDGTKIAQIALSAIARADQDIAIGMLIDVLRGSSKFDLMNKGYNLLKTYGAGKHISPEDWQQYILQMLNLGLIDVAYDQHHALKITGAGARVLRGEDTVQFVSIAYIEERAIATSSKEKRSTSKRKQAEEILFDALRDLRFSLAKRGNIPPYHVFTDKTLDEMARVIPTNEVAMKKISGVGDKKYASYGKLFIDEITKFIQEQDKAGTKIQGTTQDVTYAYYRQGMPVSLIAKERDLKPVTIYSHLAEMYEKGYDINIRDFIDKSDLKKICESLEAKGVPTKLKTLYERMNGAFDYDKLRLAVAHYKKENRKQGIIEYS
jgi:ATP-dependent DNA helicase RecQ